MTRTCTPGLAVACVLASTACIADVEPFEVPSELTASYGGTRVDPDLVDCDYDPTEFTSGQGTITFVNQRFDQALQVSRLEAVTCAPLLLATLEPGESAELVGEPRGAPFIVTRPGESEPLSAWQDTAGATIYLLP